MNKIKKILAPTDYSELSCTGLRHAFESARELGAELTVLHVVAVGDNWFSGHEEHGPGKDLLAQQKEILDKFLREKFADEMNLVEVRQRVELGTAYVNIAEMSEREEVDLIIMSTHGRTGLDHVLLGSVTEKVIAHAHCPVLAIPASAASGPVARAA